MANKTDPKTMIVGIGSSAGGLEAIRELVGTLPTDVDVSYVIVQHMSPHHKSLMTALVGRESKLSVKDVSDGIEPEANTIYVTPPKTDVVVKGGRLRLEDPSPEIASPKPSVDRFLISLAEDYGPNSMAIILSGTGSDGAYGVQAIREAGGITIAQDDSSAKYDGMPTSAVETGCVDLILRPMDIGKHLEKILSSPRDFRAFRKDDVDLAPVDDLLQILLARTRVDFREYKQSTIQRRIERRMVALGIDTQEEYTAFCRRNPHAVDALFKDLLISVTRFFRDGTEFDDLRECLPELLEKNKFGRLRVWVPGCATGEEAYSVAMLLAEELGGPEVLLKNQVQIFATDIDSAAIQMARSGIYNASALSDVPKPLAEKYFVRHGDGVRVIEMLRSAILFSEHNLCQDPPFQNVDLISCRNLLIYFGNSLQQKVMSRFHYSMKSTSLLFLGTAESVAGSDDLFAQRSESASRIYQKRTLNKRDFVATRIQSNSFTAPKKFRTVERPEIKGPSSERQLFDALATSLGENSILVADDYSIIQVYGDISKYIELSATSNLRLQINLLRSPLREEARSLITLALKRSTMRSGVRHLLSKEDDREVRLDVYPIYAKGINERAALVVFSPIDIAPADVNTLPVGETTEVSEIAHDRIQTLEAEVATTREALQQTIEELETSNEELQSLNEELQSTNEELQATNEELETSNEELQSTNEELITVNEELQVNSTELAERTSELVSVLESAPAAILVVDSALQVNQATHSAIKLFKLPLPLSRPHISQCALPEGFPSLGPICNEALQIGHASTKEFVSLGSSFKINCSPFFDTRGRLLGVTIVVMEFPELARDMELILEKSPFLMNNRTKEGTILRISKEAAKAMNVSRHEAEGKTLSQLMTQEEADIVMQKDQYLISHPDQVLRETEQVTPKGGGDPIWVSNNTFAYHNNAIDEISIFSLGTDVTEIVEARNELALQLQQSELLQEKSGIGHWNYTVGTKVLYWSPGVFDIHGLNPDLYDPEVESALDFYKPGKDSKMVTKAFEKVLEDGGEFELDATIIRRDGSEVPIKSHGVAVSNDKGQVIRILGLLQERQV
ncbi:chemotaxis protein CheB [Algirhabdus cladophorae]|uniref:chemotaxis protein CheB n=1 Tax=Algirhabdus cladophorae TaxID=3377108 RepID=UPI003B84B4FC